MDSWVVALRGDEDALVPVRALLGAPIAWFGAIEVFGCDTVDPTNAGAVFARLADLATGAGGAVVLDREHSSDARERAVALACAAVPGEILFDRATRARLDGTLLFVNASAREGWALPVPAAALAPVAPLRSDARRAVGLLPRRPALVGRVREVRTLVGMMKQPGVVVIRADGATGGGRLVQEAADLAERTFDRLPIAMLRQPLEDAVAHTERLTGDWLVIDPITDATVQAAEALVRALPPAQPVIVRVEGDIAFDVEIPERIVKLGPLREFDRHALVAAMLGPATDRRLVSRLARRGGGAPGRLVEAVRAAVQLGEVARESETWTVRTRRPLRPRHLPPDPITARMTDLPTPLYRALVVTTSVGSGARDADVLAALRATITADPAAMLDPLALLAFVSPEHDGVQITGSLHALLPFDDVRVDRLGRTGVLAAGSRAELLVRAGRTRDGSVAFARAARLALDDGMLASAVRFSAAAHGVAGNAARADEVVSVSEAVMHALGALATFTTATDETESTTSRTPLLDPEALDASAVRCGDKNAAAAKRLRRLAAVMRGDGASDDRIPVPDDASSDPRDVIARALAQAASGDLNDAVRTTLRVLATARRNRTHGAEVASLALLGTLLRAAGRDEEARRMTLGVQRLRSRVGNEAPSLA